MRSSSCRWRKFASAPTSRAKLLSPHLRSPRRRKPRFPNNVPTFPANKPLRFVWLIDAEQNFGIESDDFIRLIGPQTTATLVKPWPHIAETLALDPQGRVAAALATNQTFSGVTTQWPADGSDERLAVDLSGLPVFDAERNIQGYRGFGICRDTALMRELAELRSRPPEAAPVVEPPVADDAQPEPSPRLRSPLKPPRPSRARPWSPSPSSRKRRALPTRNPRPSAKSRASSTTASRAARPCWRTISATSAATRSAMSARRSPRRLPSPPKRDAVQRAIESEWPILDKLPIGILIYRLNELIYANRAFLEWTGYGSLQALQAAGGLDSLFIEPSKEPNGNGKNGKSLTISYAERQAASGAGPAVVDAMGRRQRAGPDAQHPGAAARQQGRRACRPPPRGREQRAQGRARYRGRRRGHVRPRRPRSHHQSQRRGAVRL